MIDAIMIPYDMTHVLVVVKSHLFPQFVQLNRKTGTSSRHWGDRRVCGYQSRVGGHCTRELHMGGRSRVNRDGQAIRGSKVVAAVTHNSDS